MCLHLKIDMDIQFYEWNPSYSSFIDQTMAENSGHRPVLGENPEDGGSQSFKPYKSWV